MGDLATVGCLLNHRMGMDLKENNVPLSLSSAIVHYDKKEKKSSLIKGCISLPLHTVFPLPPFPPILYLLYPFPYLFCYSLLSNILSISPRRFVFLLSSSFLSFFSLLHPLSTTSYLQSTSSFFSTLIKSQAPLSRPLHANFSYSIPLYPIFLLSLSHSHLTYPFFPCSTSIYPLSFHSLHRFPLFLSSPSEPSLSFNLSLLYVPFPSLPSSYPTHLVFSGWNH